MKNALFFALIIMTLNITFILNPLSAEEPPKKISKKNLELSLNAGYRQDFLQWNIAGLEPVTFSYVNIISELTWENIRIFEFELKGRYFIKDAFFSLSFSYGRILSGENQDSDYLGNDRTNEFSRSNNSSDSGSVYHVIFDGGYRLNLVKDRLTLYPRMGFAVYIQNFTMTDGNQTINTLGGTTGPFAGLNSSYSAQWSSPFLGLDIQVKALDFLSVNLGYEQHFPFYSAEADWNLRTDFSHPVSFEHIANGYGMNFLGALIFSVSDSFDINASFIYRYWYTNPGDDITYFSDGTYGTTPLNEVIWKSYSVRLGVSYRY